MEEQVSWKGQSFTLLVFTGLVFLCSIFFVLGMLVGRGQGERSAKAGAPAEEAKSASAAGNSPEKKESGIASFQGVETGKPKALPADPEPPPVAPAPKAADRAEPVLVAAPEKSTLKPYVSEKMIYVQVAAFEKEAKAKSEQDKLQKLGFAAIITSGDGPNKLYHVQVGPFSSAGDADEVRKKLEALGYKTIKKQ